jgi:hypothetical protein
MRNLPKNQSQKASKQPRRLKNGAHPRNPKSHQQTKNQNKPAKPLKEAIKAPSRRVTRKDFKRGNP